MHVRVIVEQVVLVCTRVGVLPAVVRVGVLMLDVLVIVRRVGMAVGLIPMAVFMGVPLGVRVLFGHDSRSLLVSALSELFTRTRAVIAGWSRRAGDDPESLDRRIRH